MLCKPKVPAATLYWIIWFHRASINVEPKAKTKWSREQTSQVATSINLKCTIRTKHKFFMVIACMCICINIFTEYAVYDYYREKSPSRRSSRILPQDSCYSFAIDCIISELDSRFSSLSRTASKVLYLVPTIAVDGKHAI